MEELGVLSDRDRALWTRLFQERQDGHRAGLTLLRTFLFKPETLHEQGACMSDGLTIRDLQPGQRAALGRLMVEVYAGLDGFPKPADQPTYYEMLADIGSFADKPSTRVLVATAAKGALVGGVVYFGDMAQYGSGGTATTVTNASGIRLLGVDPRFRNTGAGKALTLALHPARRGTPDTPRSSCTPRRRCRSRGDCTCGWGSSGRRTWTSCSRASPCSGSGSNWPGEHQRRAHLSPRSQELRAIR